MDRTNPDEIAMAIARLDAWERVGGRNWAIVTYGSDRPFIVSVVVGDGKPVSGRLLVFAGLETFRDYMISRQFPDYGVATGPTDFLHYEMFAAKDGSVELFSYRPGFMPLKPDAAERGALAPILYESYGLFLRMEENPELMTMYAEEGAMFSRTEIAGGKWKDAPLPVPKNETVQCTEKVSVDRKTLDTVATYAVKTDTVWEVDFLFYPQFHTVESRPRLLYLLVAVDAATGERRLWQKLSVGDSKDALLHMWEGLAARLLKRVDEFGAVPGEIKIRSRRVARFLRPLGMKLPWKMSIHSKLPALEKVVHAQLEKGLR